MSRSAGRFAWCGGRRVGELICLVMFVSPNEGRTPRPVGIIHAGFLTHLTGKLIELNSIQLQWHRGGKKRENQVCIWVHKCIWYVTWNNIPIILMWIIFHKIWAACLQDVRFDRLRFYILCCFNWNSHCKKFSVTEESQLRILVNSIWGGTIVLSRWIWRHLGISDKYAFLLKVIKLIFSILI